MRWIKKPDTHPPSLDVFIKAQEPLGLNLDYEHGFNSKGHLCRELIEEQFGLCGYTGTPIDERIPTNNSAKHVSFNAHVEHLKPQSECRQELINRGSKPGRVLGEDMDHRNMIAALRVDGSGPEQFGATYKGNTPIPVWPTHQGCESRFTYRQDGAVEGLDDDAKQTVAILNLNHETLCHWRRGAIDAWLDPDASLTRKDLERLIHVIDEPKDGQLPGFSFCVKSAALSLMAFSPSTPDHRNKNSPEGLNYETGFLGGNAVLKRNFSSWLIESAVILGAVVILLPVFLIFITAFKPDSEIIHFLSVLPQNWTLENFKEVLGNSEEIPILRWLMNSLFISSMITALILVVDSLAAYALARLKLPGGKWVFMLIVGTLMVPGQILLVPVYLILNSLGWLDTPWSLIIPAGAGAFGVFLLHQFFLGIPRDLEDAAAIDGCSKLGILWHVVLPLSRPALATLGIFTFVGSWNDFLGPLVFLESVDKYTLPVGIALFQTSYYAEYGLTLSASVICTLPVLIVFLLFQKHIIKGIALTGLKE